MDELWACTTCAACVQACPVLIDSVPGNLIGLRQSLVMMESDFPQEATTAFKGLEVQGNPWGVPQDRRMEWAEGLDVPVMADLGGREVEYLLWVGCAGSTDPRARKTNQALVRVLKAAGVDFATLGPEEKCTGDPARRMGNEYLFAQLAQENIETFKQYKFRKILVTCPHCLNSLGKDYREFGTSFTVVHHSQLLAELLAAGRVPLDAANGLDGAVTFHDPCYLGRYNQTVEPPRDVLVRLGAKTVEMEKSRQNGFCCGAGGGRIFLEETIGKRVNVERTEQALATGATTVAVGCPFCMTMLTDGTKAKNVEGSVQVKDLAELVAERLRGGRTAVSRVGFCLDPVFAEHDAGTGHPERPERLDAVRRGLREGGLLQDLVRLAPRAATREELLRVHTPAHVDRLAAPRGGTSASTPTRRCRPARTRRRSRRPGPWSRRSTRPRRRARPGLLRRAPPGPPRDAGPGHGLLPLQQRRGGRGGGPRPRPAARGRRSTSTSTTATARRTPSGGTRGSSSSPRTSSPSTPGTGALDEVGEGEGRGFTVNLPMPAGPGDGEYRRAYREIVEPIGRAFDPELVLVSAGFDAHRDDPLGGMGMSAAGFAELMDVCLAVASGSARARWWRSSRAATTWTASPSRRPPSWAGCSDGRFRPATAARPGFGALLETYRTEHSRHWPVLKSSAT